MRDFLLNYSIVMSENVALQCMPLMNSGLSAMTKAHHKQSSPSPRENSPISYAKMQGAVEPRRINCGVKVRFTAGSWFFPSIRLMSKFTAACISSSSGCRTVLIGGV
ncbi:MAG TPA: hypothetical protein VKC51_03090, partial [Lacunisphaera sp.]|nr:hypothetical protein [Lacunisphaera sp.]